MTRRGQITRRSIVSVLLAFAVGFILQRAGLATVAAGVVGLVILAIGLLWIAFAIPDGDGDWPPRPVQKIDGARRETIQLAWALRTRSEAINHEIIGRVHAVAVARLASHGLDADKPGDHSAILALGGPLFVAIVGPPDGWPTALGPLAATLDAIEAIPRVERTGPRASTPVIQQRKSP